MNSRQALTEARRRWGKTAMVREYSGKPSTPESREAARQEWLAFKALPDGEQKLQRDRRDELFAEMHARYRCTVGRVVMGLFFEVQGQGDNWAEAFEAADRHRAAMLGSDA